MAKKNLLKDNAKPVPGSKNLGGQKVPGSAGAVDKIKDAHDDASKASQNPNADTSRST